MPQDQIRRYLKHGTLPQLRVFEASVRLGSLARAAEELHMAPPTASVQIKKLTETIGLPLFEHIGKRVYPTEVGRTVYASCNDLFRALATLEETLAGMRGLERGRLRLAATPAARYFAPRLLGAFVQRHPAIEASLEIANRHGLLERLDANRDDLYLFADAPRDRDVLVQAILPNPLVVLARADHVLARERQIAFARLAKEPFLLREAGSGTRAAVLDLFAQHGMAPMIRMELDSNEAIREAIRAGMGVSILPRYMLALEAENEHLACLDVEGFPLESYWKFVYPVGKRLSPAARAFLDFSRTEAKSLAREGLRLPESKQA